MGIGSKRWFPYIRDNAAIHAVLGDESNVELINNLADGQTIIAGTEGLPREIKPRYVKLKAGDGTTKDVPVLDRAVYDDIAIGDSFAEPAVGNGAPAGTSFVVVQKIPERIKNPPIPLDTGKNDGDQP